MDTVAVMKNLDLIITVDTSIAHCAGGLGIPVWVMLPKPPDWRWMLNRDDTPWYPTMRLFRQSNPDSWEDVFENIVQELTPIVRYTQLKRVVA
jgi:ADP-heptose:LPS heptosyltransferase